MTSKFYLTKQFFVWQEILRNKVWRFVSRRVCHTTNFIARDLTIDVSADKTHLNFLCTPILTSTDGSQPCMGSPTHTATPKPPFPTLWTRSPSSVSSLLPSDRSHYGNSKKGKYTKKRANNNKPLALPLGSFRIRTPLYLRPLFWRINRPFLLRSRTTRNWMRNINASSLSGGPIAGQRLATSLYVIFHEAFENVGVVGG